MHIPPYGTLARQLITYLLTNSVTCQHQFV